VPPWSVPTFSHVKDRARSYVRLDEPDPRVALEQHDVHIARDASGSPGKLLAAVEWPVFSAIGLGNRYGLGGANETRNTRQKNVKNILFISSPIIYISNVLFISK